MQPGRAPDVRDLCRVAAAAEHLGPGARALLGEPPAHKQAGPAGQSDGVGAGALAGHAPYGAGRQARESLRQGAVGTAGEGPAGTCFRQLSLRSKEFVTVLGPVWRWELTEWTDIGAIVLPAYLALTASEARN